jgi:hypothetical protein
VSVILSVIKLNVIMLSVAIKLVMQSVIKLNVIMLSVAIKPILLSVIKLNVVMLSVVASLEYRYDLYLNGLARVGWVRLIFIAK